MSEYPKRIYPEAGKGVTVRSAEEEFEVMGRSAPLLSERDKLVEELVKGFREHLAGLSDDELRDNYAQLMGEEGAEEAEADADANADKADGSAFDHDGDGKAGGAPKGGNRKPRAPKSEAES
jgi:hypothetical protein